MPESIPGPGQQDPFDAWLARFIAIRNAAPRYTGSDPDYLETTIGDDGDSGFGSYWTDDMFLVSDEIVVTGQRLASTDPHDLASMTQQIEDYQNLLFLLAQLDELGEQAGFAEVDGVGEGLELALDNAPQVQQGPTPAQVQQHRNALTQSQFDAFVATQDNLRGVDGLYDTNADNDVDWMDAGRIYRHWSEAFEQAANASTGQTALAYHQTAVLFDEYSDMAFATGTALGAYQRLDPD